jgi:two-component system heavy metal sensor histidine kinase CusS
MCSKSTKPTELQETPRPATRVWSITQRLTLLYAASTATLLLLSAGFLYWTLQRNLDHTRHGLLASKIEVLRLLLREQPDNADVLASEVEHEASESQPLKYYIRVLDEQGLLLLETPRMIGVAPASWFPPPIEVGTDLRREMEGSLRHYGALHLLSANATVGNPGGEQRTLQIAMDGSTGDDLLNDYRDKLLTVLSLGLVFAAVAGVWVARKGMKPLTEITQAAQHITASHLHERIAGLRWPAELAQMATAFDDMLDRLEHSFMRLSQFSADLAHALRTPLHNLRGEAEVALARNRTPEEYRHVLASSLEECERLSRMIDGLLFLARADDPKTAVQRVRFDARKEIEAVREFYEALASEQEVTVSCEGDAWVTADPTLFRRAVSNLLGNALRHTAAKGSVYMSVSSGPDQVTEVCVRDTGSGIASDQLPKIFDRFYRVSVPHSPVPGGIGLGLAIVQSIMRLHGGTVRVQSVLGQGATFTLNFPVGVASPPPAR